MERFWAKEAENHKHRAETRSKRVGTAVIGFSLALSLANSLFVAGEYRKRQHERDEYQAVYPAIDDYLYYQGYSDRVKLRIDIDNNAFTFINLSDETGPNLCVGKYAYHRNQDINIGEIACARLGGNTPPEPGSIYT